MGIEYQMANEPIEDVKAIENLLQRNWEPFAIYRGEVWFRSQFHNEDHEPQSSTKHQNWAGNEPDAADMVVEE